MTEASPRVSAEHRFELLRHFDATPSQLYRYFTDPKHLSRWFGPKGVRCLNVCVDLRVGGAYRLEMHNSDGTSITLVGRYLELEESSMIRMTWRWQREGETEEGEDTVVTIRFSEAKEGALLTLTHENFSQPDERDRHESGWTSSLDCLEEAIDEDA